MQYFLDRPGWLGTILQNALVLHIRIYRWRQHTHARAHTNTRARLRVLVALEVAWRK